MDNYGAANIQERENKNGLNKIGNIGGVGNSRQMENKNGVRQV